MMASFQAIFDSTLPLPRKVSELVLELHQGLHALSQLPGKERRYLWRRMEEGPAKDMVKRWFEQDRPWPKIHLEMNEKGELRVWGEEGFWLTTLLLHTALKATDSPLILSLACSHKNPPFGGTACVLNKHTRRFGGTEAFVRNERYVLRKDPVDNEKDNDDESTG